MADETPYQRDRRRQVEDLQNLPAFVRYLMGEHNYFSELDRKSSSRLFCVDVLDLERYGFSAEVLYSRILESVERPPYFSVSNSLHFDHISYLYGGPHVFATCELSWNVDADFTAACHTSSSNRQRLWRHDQPPRTHDSKRVGIAVLDTRDIINSQKPLQDLIKTRNFCVGTWGRLRVISKRSLFGQTEVYRRPQFKNVLTETLT